MISSSVVTPYLTGAFTSDAGSALPLKSEDMMIMVLLVVVIILLPLLFYGRSKRKAGHIYLAGAGEGDDRTYHGAMEKDVKFSLRNWYMDKIFGEDKFGKIGNILTICVIGLGLCSSIPILLMVSSMFLR
jgi:ech hydrogenase subunit A